MATYITKGKYSECLKNEMPLFPIKLTKSIKNCSTEAGKSAKKTGP